MSNETTSSENLINAFKAALELLKVGWCTKVYARDAEGIARDECDPRACCYCALGAIRKVTRLSTNVNWALRREMISVLAGKVGHVPKWNDSSTKEVVIGVFEQIINEISVQRSVPSLEEGMV